jgi:formylglycine-generating enzyme required for sulfatase activity
MPLVLIIAVACTLTAEKTPPATEPDAAPIDRSGDERSEWPSGVPGRGSLRVESEPSGARLWLDGEFIGTTPRLVESLQSGTHEISLAYPSHEEFKEQVRVARGRETAVSITLKPKPGRLTITSYPDGGEIWLDGKEIGKVPWTGMVEPGPHDVIIQLAGHAMGWESVNMPPDGEKTVELTLSAGTPVLIPQGGERLLRRSDQDFKFPGNTPLRGNDGAPMVLVPAGEFLMGSVESDVHAYSNEKPRHSVRLKAFFIDKFEVPNALYRAFLKDVRDNGHRRCLPGEPPEKKHEPGALSIWGTEWNAPRQPVIEVDWWDAASYCRWAGKRLPTEAEWEKAARGTDARTYPWGEEPLGSFPQGNFGDKAYVLRNPEWTWIVPNYDDRFSFTAPIGSFPRGASPFGAQDMAGNVWEWVSDWFAEGTYRVSKGNDPTGPPTGRHRVLRGGSWNDTDFNLRSSSRLAFLPGFRVNNVGFRCAQDAE